ncbi:MAG: hypothetical protein RIC12_00675 [Pirellulales bacterium]
MIGPKRHLGTLLACLFLGAAGLGNLISAQTLEYERAHGAWAITVLFVPLVALGRSWDLRRMQWAKLTVALFFSTGLVVIYYLYASEQLGVYGFNVAGVGLTAVFALLIWLAAKWDK